MGIIKLLTSIVLAIGSAVFVSVTAQDELVEVPIRGDMVAQPARGDSSAGQADKPGTASDPESRGDENGDGVVDILDALEARGEPVVPLLSEDRPRLELGWTLRNASDGYHLALSLSGGPHAVRGYSLGLQAAKAESLPLDVAIPHVGGTSRGFLFAQHSNVEVWDDRAGDAVRVHALSPDPATDDDAALGRLLVDLRIGEIDRTGVYDLVLEPASFAIDGDGLVVQLIALRARLADRRPLDLDHDGEIDEDDFALALQEAATGSVVADLDGNGVVGPEDALLIRGAIGRPLMELRIITAGDDTAQDNADDIDVGGGSARRDVLPDESDGASGRHRPGIGMYGTTGTGPSAGNSGHGLSNADRVDADGDATAAPRVDRLDPPADTYRVDQFGLDTFTVGFDQDVTIPPGSIRLWGTQSSADIPVTTEYDAVTQLLTVRTVDPILANRLTLVVDYTITNNVGLALDGEVGDITAPSLPSGDGAQGGQAVFRFTSLQGDANRDGVVDQDDAQVLLNVLGLGVDDPGFDPDADLNGDGLVNVLDIVILSGGMGAELITSDGEPLVITSRAPGPDVPYVATELSAVTVTFDFPVKQCSLSPTALYVELPGGAIQAADFVTATNAGTATLFCFDPPLPSENSYTFRLSEGLTDLTGDAVDAGNGLAWSVAVEPPPPTQLTAPATIFGTIFDATSGEPMRDAFVLHYIFDTYEEGQQPLPGIAFTDNNGQFQLQTIEFEGTEKFLLRLLKPGHAENLRVVDVMAGRCETVQEAVLNPINPPQTVPAIQGGTLEDELDGQLVTLNIPPNALTENSEISMTILSTSEAIRDRLPNLVTGAGVFIDIAGVFGDVTDEPVTLHLPNIYNLPLGSQVRLGKISHTDATWTDLRNPFGAPDPDDPEQGIGIVIDDGQGGSVIEVQFDNFCTVCTGYCLNEQAPNGVPDGKNPEEGGPCPSCNSPGNDSNGSVVNIPEGYLWEEVSLPGFGERGGNWGLSLGYASYSASPSTTLRGRVSYPSPNSRPVAATTVRFNIEGHDVAGVFAEGTTSDRLSGTFIWDGRDVDGNGLPTGSYEYSFEAISFYADAQIAVSDIFGGPPTQAFNATFPGLTTIRTDTIVRRAVIVNESESDYGSGWRVLNESRLYFDPDGCAVLVFGNSQYRVYRPIDIDAGTFTSPDGEFSTLARQSDGTYLRSFIDGSFEVYSPLGRLLRRSDRYGYITTFAYDSENRLDTVVSPVGNSVHLTYDNNGHLDTVADSAGRTTDFEVDTDGRLVSVTDPLGSTRTFSYDDADRLTEQGGPRGERKTYQYDPDHGRVVAAEAYDTDGTTLLRRREYMPSILQSEIGAAVAAGQATFDTPLPIVNDRIDMAIDGRGALTQYRLDSDGRVSVITDALTREVTLLYNENNLVSRRVRPDGSFTDYTYNSNGDLTRITESFNSASIDIEYNGPFGMPTLIRDQEGNPVTIAYYPDGNVESISDAELNTTTFFYEDTRFPDQLTRVLDPEGGEVRVEYDSAGNPAALIDPLTRRTEFGYDDRGNTDRITDARGFATTFQFDALNRAISATDPETNTTILSYAEDGCGCSTGNLTKVTLPNGSSIKYGYDGLGRQISRTDQGGRVSTVAYGPEGSPVLATRRTGDRLRYVNDPLGRVLAIVNEGTGETLSEFGYNVNGDLETASNDVSLIEMTYDPLGRLDFERQTVFPPPAEAILPGDEPTPRLPVSSEIDYAYDLANRLTRREDDLGAEVYRYDGRRLVREMEFVDANGGSLVWGITRDGLGRRTVIEYPNGLSQSFDYDMAGQLREIDVYNTTTLESLDRIMYSSYLPSGQLEASTRVRPGEEDLAWDYGYSPAGRLNSATISRLPEGVTTEDQTADYAFDGRLQSINGRQVTFDDAGRMTSIELPSGTARAMEWDEFDQLRSVTETTGPTALMKSKYAFDPFGRRVFEEANGIGVVHRYDGYSRLGSRDPIRLESEREIRLLDEVDDLLAKVDFTGSEIDFAHSDRLGSIRAWTGTTGSLIGTTDSAASGQVLRSDSYQVIRTGIGGLQRDAETSLTYARFRQLDDETASFLSEDPMGLSGGLNLWAYTFGDPVNYVDPYGLEACPASEKPDDDWLEDLLDSLPFIGAVRKRGNAINDLADAMNGPPQQLRCAVANAENAERRVGLEATAAGISLDAYNMGRGGLRKGRRYGNAASEPTQPVTGSDVDRGFVNLIRGMFSGGGRDDNR